MYRYILSILFILLLGETTHLAAQVAARMDYRILVAAIEKDIENGKKRALRDLGTLLDEPKVRPKIIEILQNYTLFTSKELTLNDKLSKKTFLSFYYKKEQQIYFSPLLRMFYAIPIEARMVESKLESFASSKVIDPSILLRKYTRSLDTAFQIKEEKKILNQIDSIAFLRSTEAYEVLLKFIEKDFSFFKNKKVLYWRLLRALAHYPERETLRTVLRVIQKENLNAETLLIFLAELTNVKLKPANSAADIAQQYEFYLDSLGSMRALRAFGYESMVGYKNNFFEFDVDYYGKVLSEADEYPWIQFNAIEDIQKTQHPRSLFYIAAQVFHYRNNYKSLYAREQYLELLQRITRIKVAIKNKNSAWTTQPDWKNDPIALHNFLFYWAAKYEDYEWDEVRNNFVNKNEAVAQTETYERLFRRLNSSNDSVAWASYKTLTQGDAIEVVNLARKYKDLLRSYNKILPPLKHQYLEQLVRLTDFCKRNNFEYSPAKDLKTQLEILKSDIQEQERFELENEIIQQIDVEQTAILEYWGCLNPNHRDFSFSIGRILTRVYAENWDTMILNDDLLRFYLKKAHLLSQIGVIGVCNTYLKPFDSLDKDLVARLKKLVQSESDKDIVQTIQTILANGQTDNILTAFLDAPLSIEKSDLKNLPPLNRDQYLDVFDVVQFEEDKRARNQVLEYIKIHAQLDMVPDLMRLLQMQIATPEVAKVLKVIYDTKDTPENWLKKWYEEQDSFQSWGARFFDKKLKALEEKETLSIKDINAVTNSPFYSETYKTRCLEALSKLKKTQNIRRLKIKPALSLETDLAYFKAFKFSYKVLDDIPKLFQIGTETSTILDFLNEQSQAFSIENKGAFYNSLFRSSWFLTSLNNGDIPTAKADTIQAALLIYLSENELISEFEEQATIQNIAQLKSLGKTLEEKLLMSFRLDIDAAPKAKIQKAIIATVRYEEIPIVMKHFDQLSPAYQYNFLNTDFGLPIFELDNVQVHQDIIAQHKKLDEASFYRHYLEAFGLDFQDKKGRLDYPKIIKILEHDIVAPFVNGGGTQRDFFVFGLIKLLEFEFKTTLGFHPKLNENQVFYAFSASKRAAAWRAYLKK